MTQGKYSVLFSISADQELELRVTEEAALERVLEWDHR